jgi:hypothetical protein
MSVATAIRAGEGEARWWFAALAEIKASAADTDGQLTIVEVTEPPGAQTRGAHGAHSSTNATTRANPALARFTLIGKQLTLKPCGRGIASRFASFSIWQ